MAIVPNERDNFIAQVGVENRLHVTAVKGVRTFVVEAEAVDGIDAIKFDAPTIDEIRKGANHALAVAFPFIARAGGKAEERRAPVTKNDDTHIAAQTWRIPAMIFAFHVRDRSKTAGKQV